jgi:exodeoxyribonuclease VIII
MANDLFMDWLSSPEFRLSFSTAKNLLESPAKFQWEITNKLMYEPDEPTESMRLGSLVHTLILEPQEFGTKFVIQPDFGRTKPELEKKEHFFLENKGKIIIKDKEVDKAERCIRYIPDHVMDIINGGVCELEIHQPIAELPFKGFIDCYVDNRVIEVKTTSESSPDKLMASFFNLKYPMQAAIYGVLAKKEFQLDYYPNTTYLIIQTVAPYRSYFVPADKDYHLYGQKLLDKSLSIFNMAKREGLWDNGWDIQSIGLPAWAQKQIEE